MIRETIKISAKGSLGYYELKNKINEHATNRRTRTLGICIEE
jgi:hypothetical protein